MFGIYPEAIENLIAIFRRYQGIEEAVIYGSRAKGNYREGSDVDLTFKGSITDKELGMIYAEIEDSTIPYLFDLSVYNTINSEGLKEHIDRVGKIFYKRIA